MTKKIERIDDMIERVAITLSLIDPDERGLPQGVEMADFYRLLAQNAIKSMLYPSKQMIDAVREIGGPQAADFANVAWKIMIYASLGENK